MISIRRLTLALVAGAFPVGAILACTDRHETVEPTAPPASLPVEAPKAVEAPKPVAPPFVREALPVDEAKAKDERYYELKLVVDPSLAECGRAEAEADTTGLRAGGKFQFESPRPDVATVRTYRGNGFRGHFAELVFDARPDVVRVRAGTFRDVGPPFETFWRNLEGHVTVSDLTLASGTWVEVDLTGAVESPKGKLSKRQSLRHLVRPTR